MKNQFTKILVWTNKLKSRLLKLQSTCCGSKFKTLQKVAIFSTSALLLTGYLSTPIGVLADTNSNDRRIGAIKAGFNKAEGGSNTDSLDSLTEDQLRTLGIYLSNFYVPFSTQLGSKSNSKDEVEKSKEKMVTALTKNLYLNEATAKKAVDVVFNVSSKSTPLYFGYGIKQSNGKYSVKKVKDNGTTGNVAREARFSEFLYQITGAETQYSGEEKYPEFHYNKSTTRGYLYYSENKQTKSLSAKSEAVDGKNIIFNWNINGGSKMTASQTVFAMILSTLKSEGSIATSVFDIPEDKLKGTSASDIGKAIYETYVKKEDKTIKGMYENSFFNWKMSLDAFGNILVNTGTHTYVAVPACMNPYLYESSGTGVGGAVPINNLPMYSNYRHKLGFKSLGQDKKDGYYTMSYNLNIANAFEGGNALKITSKTSASAWDAGFGVDKTEQIRDAIVTQDWINHFNYKKVTKEDVSKSNGKGGEGGLNGETGIMLEALVSGNRLSRGYLTFRDKDGYKINRATSISVNNKPWLSTYPYSKDYMFSHQTDGNDYWELPPFRVPKSDKFKYIGGLVNFDTIGTLVQDSKVSTEKLKIQKSYLEDKGDIKDVSIDDYEKGTENRGSVVYLEDNQDFTSVSANVYVTYVMTSLYDSKDKANIIKEYGFAFVAKDRLPDLNAKLGSSSGDGNTELSEEAIKETQAWAYWFLNPTEGASYLGRWFKTKANGVLLTMHQGITGANEAQVTTGMTRYVGFSSYLTTPSLTDMSWTQKLVQIVSDYGIYLIILVIIIFAIHFILGQITLTKAVIGVIVFTLGLPITTSFIEFSVSASNSFSNYLYSRKFDYWALMQNQAYIQKYNEVAESGTNGEVGDYLSGMRELQESDSGTQGMYENNSTIGANVTLKWMTPKKNNYFEQIRAELEQKTVGSEAMSFLTKSILNKSLSGEAYDENTNAVYLYRSYADIGNFSRNFYGNSQGSTLFSGTGEKDHNFGDINASLSTAGLYDSVGGYITKDTTEDGSLKFKITKGFVNALNNSQGNTNITPENFKRIYGAISSNAISQVMNTDISKVKLGDKVGIEQNAFLASPANMNNHQVSLKESIDGVLKEGNTLSDNYTDEELLGNAIYALYSESPYYYFSWYLYDNGLDTKADAKGNFKTMMLKDKSSFFYNYTIKKNDSGYGAMKDYLDMSSLFHVIIPYMRKANEPVKQWTDLYGTKPYDDIPSDDASAGQFKDKNSDSYYKYWHNNNLSRLYNQYTAWVDAMYDTDYAKPEKIKYAGKTQTVEDPINPESYVIRPMVFSESEMLYYGLKENQLTKVEQKILEVNKQTRLDWLRLMNYYNYDDVVLDNAASMIATFNFNRIFSQKSMTGESFELYPQNFELKNFTYDAYLRLILSQATGEDLISDADAKYTDIYERVVEKGNFFTGLFLVINDLIAQYGIPLIRWITIVLFFILGITLLLVSVLIREVRPNKVFGKVFIIPLFAFLLINNALALVVSTFLSNGVTTVTGELQTTLSLGDPTLTLLLLMLINIGVLVAFGFILFKTAKNLWKYGSLAFTSIKVAVAQVASTVGGVAMGNSTILNSTKMESHTNYTSSESASVRGERNMDDYYREDFLERYVDDVNDSNQNYDNSDRYKDLFGDDFNPEELMESGRAKFEQQDENSRVDDSNFEFNFDDLKNNRELERKIAEDSSRSDVIRNMREKYDKKSDDNSKENKDESSEE